MPDDLEDQLFYRLQLALEVAGVPDAAAALAQIKKEERTLL